MATCLKCDNCNSVVTEQDDELTRWWTLERYGTDWIENPGQPKPVDRGTSTVTIRSMMVMDEDDLEEVDESMLDVYIDESQGTPMDVTLHFCKAACLAAWATQASDFEN